MGKKPSKNTALSKIRSLIHSAVIEKSEKLVKEAHKLKLKTNTRIPRELRMKYCKYCKIPFDSSNSAVRKIPKTINIKCLKCGKIMKIGL